MAKAISYSYQNVINRVIKNGNSVVLQQIVDEVLANNEQISLLRRSRMECRRSFCEKANALYHLNINVKFAAPHISPINRLALGGDIQGLVNSL